MVGLMILLFGALLMGLTFKRLDRKTLGIIGLFVLFIVYGFYGINRFL